MFLSLSLSLYCVLYIVHCTLINLVIFILYFLCATHQAQPTRQNIFLSPSNVIIDEHKTVTNTEM